MSRNGYPKAYAAAVVAAAGTFAVLIPPSVAMVIFALLADESIGAMLLAGVVPGILSCSILAAFVIFQGYRRRTAVSDDLVAESATPTPAEPARVGALGGDAIRAGSGHSATATLPADLPSSELRESIVGVVFAAILFTLVMGGIYTGFFTASESAAVGSVAALILGTATVRFSPTRTIRFVVAALKETVTTTGMIFLLLVGGAIFSYFTSTTGIARDIAVWTAGLPLPPSAVVAVILVALLTLGTIMDGLTIMLLTVPILAPVVVDMGFDGIWFGILVLKCVEIGLITPPVGLNVYIISGLIPGVAVQNVFKAITPFILLDLAFTAVLFAFPDISLWLPRAAGLL
jgi:TRAP-type C4-dicarboxylate transport system permease large subunit